MSDIEVTFWSMMKQLEDLAVSQYTKYIPELNITKKQTFLQNIQRVLTSQGNASTGRLSSAIKEFVQTAEKNSRGETLILQGFSLELLGQAIYRAIHNTPTLTASSHELAEEAENASKEVLSQVLSILRKDGLVGDSLFKSFTACTHDVFGHLDGMGLLIDETFAGQGASKFDDVLADSVTDLLKYGTELGMDRKKLLRQLTSALMTG